MPVDPLESFDPRDLGARLREARNARGWTQGQAAEALGVARTTITAIEKGDRRVRSEELARLAQVYGRKLSSLLRPGSPVEDFSVQLRGALPAETPVDADLLPHIHALERLCDDYLELERLCAAPLRRHDPPIYSMDAIDPEQVAEDVAAAERHRLGLGDAPVLNLRAVLEDEVGLRVFYLDLPSTVAGMFAFTEEHGGVVAINRHHPAERRRCSMAHEYGHFLTDRYRATVSFLGRYQRRPAAERFAETFGRAFLMPAASLRRRYHEVVRQRVRAGRGRPTAGDLYQLAHYFYVSFEALTRRLEELGLVPAGTWDRLRQRGFRVREAQSLLGLQERAADDQLLPTRYRCLAVESWQRGDLSEGQLASFLRVDRVRARRTLHEIGLERGEGGVSAPDLFLPLAAGEIG